MGILKSKYFWIGSFIIYTIPLIGIVLNQKCGLSTFGYLWIVADPKDFATWWTTIFGFTAVFITIKNHSENLFKLQEQIDLQKVSERNSRFMKCIELLGSSHVSVREGGAIALVSLGREYVTEYKHQIIKILCNHIVYITSEIEYQTKNCSRPSSEISTIVDLLFKKQGDKSFANGFNADLSRGFFKGIKLSEADFREVTFDFVDFSNAQFWKSDFSNSKWTSSTLDNVTIIFCVFNNSVFDNTKFTNIEFINNTKFNISKFKQVIFNQVNLYGTEFIGSTFFWSLIIDSDVSGAHFQGTSIYSTAFLHTFLERCKFSGSIIHQKVFFSSCLITDSDFNGAYLDDVNFHGSTIQNTAINGGGCYSFQPGEINGINTDRTFLLRKRRGQNTVLNEKISFGKSSEELIKKIKKNIGFNLEALLSNLRNNISNNMSSADDFTKGIFDESEAVEIIDQVKKVQNECGYRLGFRVKENNK